MDKQNSNKIIQSVNDNSILLSSNMNGSMDQYEDIYVSVRQQLDNGSLYSEDLSQELQSLLDKYISQILLLYKPRDIEFVKKGLIQEFDKIIKNKKLTKS